MSVHTPRVVLITGGCGFIGANHIRWMLADDPDVRIVNLDKLTYAGNVHSLADLPPDHARRYTFVQGDVADSGTVAEVFRTHQPDTVIHYAAESHVDRSIDGPDAFIRTNIHGTFVLLHAARAAWEGRDDVRFHHVSTDEVFGSLDEDGFFVETTPYDPSSPYSASKAAADHLVRAWHRTYGLNVTLSNCSNNYGPYQFPEKLIPLMIDKARRGEPLPVYGDGSNVRDWLYVVDHCRAVDTVVRHAPAGSDWVVGGNNERSNLQVVHAICDALDAREPLPSGQSRRGLVTFVTDRPGHDWRYAIDASKIQRELGWSPSLEFEEGLAHTLAWYLDRQDWVENIRSGAYRGQRLGLHGSE